MYGFAGMMDIDNDEDDMLIMTVSSLYNASMENPMFGQTGADESWLDSNIHKNMIIICNKYQDKEWIERGQHQYLIYYALHTIGTMCFQIGSKAAKSILNEKDFIDTLLSIWSQQTDKTTLTWFESRAAARTLSMLITNSSESSYKLLNNTKNINIAQVAMKQYHECVRYVIKNCCIVPSKIKGYIQDLMLKIHGRSMCYDDDVLRPISIQMGQNWMSFNGTILSSLANINNTNDGHDVIEMFSNIDIELWEKAISTDLCWKFITTDGGEANHDRCIDALRKLSKYKKIAKIISKSDLLINSFILNLRSRTSTIIHLRFDIIIENLLKYNLLNRKYYKDLCLSLILLLEVDRKRLYYTFETKPICEIAVNCIKLLFNIPQIRFVDIEYMKQFNCSHCNNLVIDPHKKNCKHHYCYFCMLKNKNNDNTQFKCSIKECQKTFKFESIKDEKFDYKTFNAINSAKCKVIINTDNICIDTMSKCFDFIKHNLQNEIINELNEEFNYFCDYMIKSKSVNSFKEMKELRIEARNIKDSGNEYFKNGQYEKAITHYTESLKICPYIFKQDRCSYFSNLALSYIQLNDYFNAYKCCLFAISSNFNCLKLLNVLNKCYQNLNVNQLFKNIDINNDYLKKVQNIIWCNFNTIFRSEYMSLKFKQTKGIKHSDFKQKMANLERTDAFFRDLVESGLERHRSTYLINVYFKLYYDEYKQFKINKKMAKKQIYQFILYALSHKTEFWIYENNQDLENEEWILIDNLLKEIQNHFYLENKLSKIENEIKQKYLILGDIKRDIKLNKIPQVIVDTIHKFIFYSPRYDVYKLNAWGVEDIVNKSKYLTLSSRVLTDCYSTGGYGVKLTDFTKTNDSCWKQIEFTEDDSGIDEFCSGVDKK